MLEPIISVRDLVADYEVREGNLRVVDHVSLDIPRGRVTGLIGESGCGKTSFIEALFDLMPRNGYIRGGQVLFDGREDILKMTPEERRRLRWEKIAMVFQAAQNSLNPVMRIKEQMVDAIQAHRRTPERQALERVYETLELVHLLPEQITKSYPHELSGGMKQRVIIAMSLLLEPEMLFLDEPTTALDLITQAYLMETLMEIHERLGVTMMVVTHDIANVARLADRLMIMYAGKIVEIGEIEEVFYSPKHPYTAGLINATPSIVGDLSQKKPIPGVPPSLLHPPPGCRFAPRCAYAQESCSEAEPPLEKIGPDRQVACHRWKEVMG